MFIILCKIEACAVTHRLVTELVQCYNCEYWAGPILTTETARQNYFRISSYGLIIIFVSFIKVLSYLIILFFMCFARCWVP